jgi:hypothetical protein
MFYRPKQSSGKFFFSRGARGTENKEFKSDLRHSRYRHHIKNKLKSINSSIIYFVIVDFSKEEPRGGE